jgi:uncharacterized membrane protein YhaH (DUF805 family)
MDSQKVTFSLMKVFLSKEGRMSRSRYWSVSIPLWLMFWLLFMVLDDSLAVVATNSLLVLFLVPAFFLSAKRLHDTDKPAWWLLLVLVPVLGPIFLFIELGCRKSTAGDNRFGDNPLECNYDYLTLP